MPSSLIETAATKATLFTPELVTERVAGIKLSYGLHQLVVHQPSGWVAHTQLVFERKRRQIGLGLADEVDRQKPCSQGQLCRLKDGACDQRGLVSTGIALKKLLIPNM